MVNKGVLALNFLQIAYTYSLVNFRWDYIKVGSNY